MSGGAEVGVDVPVPGTDADFERFVAENAAALHRFAYLVAGNREDARDAVQDALAGAYPRWSRMVGDPGAYLRRSIVNAHVSRWRRHRRETPVDQLAEAVEPDTPADRVLDAMVIGDLARDLPYRQRVALVLRYYEDRSFAEIGAVLGCSDASARSIVHRALLELRSRTEGGGDD
ncbi:MAG: SigE family RNA polymerase sigma factor [Propionicimonas sp.]